MVRTYSLSADLIAEVEKLPKTERSAYVERLMRLGLGWDRSGEMEDAIKQMIAKELDRIRSESVA